MLELQNMLPICQQRKTLKTYIQSKISTLMNLIPPPNGRSRFTKAAETLRVSLNLQTSKQMYVSTMKEEKNKNVSRTTDNSANPFL